jgi:hypothetical protein
MCIFMLIHMPISRKYLEEGNNINYIDINSTIAGNVNTIKSKISEFKKLSSSEDVIYLLEADTTGAAF